ncbi:MAG: response regulator transcription factor [Anaerolineales bacterium]|nr:response regulator transcription factor [Anaerolineales bacterium]
MSDKILIVEDEVRIVRTLRLYLEQAGFAVTAVHDGAQAIPAFRQERPSLVLLDLNLPGQDGLDVCRSLRRLGDVPIIMLTARTEEMDRLIGLELGADDYISKPFSPREVVARVRAVLRRTQGHLINSPLLQAGALQIDLAAYRAWAAGRLLDLTQTEFELLATLMRHKGHVMSRAQLLEAVQGVAFEELERAIDQHIKNVRRKLKEALGDVAIITTIYGVGYRLDEVELPHA